jgi:KipI family sensor histidine kinase inhibitor
MRCRPLGDSALLVEIAASADALAARRVHAACARLRASPLPGVLECIPSFVTIGVHYDPLILAGDDGQLRLAAWIARALDETDGDESLGEGREVTLRVRYGGEDGPDLEAVAAAVGMAVEAVIGLHAGASYTVGAVGFSPGFPYLLGLPPQLALPRRATPRAWVPAGSVAIAAGQAGIYPQGTPGGWHLLGRTDAVLFAPDRDPPALLAVGDRVRFVPETGRVP